MKIPTVAEADKLLNEAEKLNPGRWVAHSRTAALCARAVAEKCGLKAYKTLINTGKEAGQEVFHLHIHVMGSKGE